MVRKITVKVPPTRLKKKRICVKGTTTKAGVRRKPYCFTRQPSTRKGFKAERKDIGLPGKGIKRIPPLKKGKMTRVVNKIGYAKFGDVPMNKMPLLAKELVRKHGCKSAFGMAQSQVVYRKRQPNGAKKKFIRLRNEVKKKCR